MATNTEIEDDIKNLLENSEAATEAAMASHANIPYVVLRDEDGDTIDCYKATYDPNQNLVWVRDLSPLCSPEDFATEYEDIGEFTTVVNRYLQHAYTAQSNAMRDYDPSP